VTRGVPTVAVDVYAADEQAAVDGEGGPVDLDRWAALARSVLTDRNVRGDCEVSLLFVDEDAIAALNEQFLGRTGPTDVLAFPIEDDPAPGGRSADDLKHDDVAAAVVDDHPDVAGPAGGAQDVPGRR